MKFCRKCSTEKSFEDFHFRERNKGTRKAYCKSCVKLYDKVAYIEGKKTGNSKVSKAALWQRNREFVFNYLSNNPCCDCGNSDIRVLEFDHLSDKSYNISTMLKSYSIEAIGKEIAKCEVVCANCHKIRTYTRRPNYRTKMMNL